jgi:hypothetical protein
MVKVSVLYPNRKDTTFDMEYYCNLHIPMVRQLLGSALKGASVDQGSLAKNLVPCCLCRYGSSSV